GCVVPGSPDHVRPPARGGPGLGRARAHRHDRGHRRRQGPALGPGGATQGLGRARFRLLHQFRQPQGAATGRQPAGGAAAAVEAGTRGRAGAHRGHGGAGHRRRGRCLFRHPAAREPAERLGLAAVAAHGLAGGFRGPLRRLRARIRRRRRAAAAALVGFPGGAGDDRVLVRRALPPAPAPRLRAPQRPVAKADAVPASIGPRRIVWLTEEPTEVLYALGEQERIVGISGFTVRPARARKEKPKVSAFTSAKIGKILELEPDFVVGFSDIQADIAAELVRHGVEVWISNHRSVAGILDYIRRLGALVGAAARAEAWAGELERGLEAVAARARQLPRRPKVYFEEWDEPRISGIQWVAELVRIAGGDDIFPERAAQSLARHQIGRAHV